MSMEKFAKKNWKIILVLAMLGLFINNGGLGNFANQLIAPSSAYVGETTTVTYYCDASDGCNLPVGTSLEWLISVDGEPFAYVGSSTLQRSSVGNWATYNYRFLEVGNTQIKVGKTPYFAIAQSIDVKAKTSTTCPSSHKLGSFYCSGNAGYSCDSDGKDVQLIACSTGKTCQIGADSHPNCVVDTPQCSAKYVCNDINTRAYQNTDCSKTQTSVCQFGCENGNCRSSSDGGTPCPPSAPLRCDGGTLVDCGVCGCGSCQCPTGFQLIDGVCTGKAGCVQVVTPAINPSTNVCMVYSTPCDVPVGWSKVQSCSTSGGTGSGGTVTTDKCAGYQGLDNIQCAMGGQNNFFMFVVLIIIIIGGAVMVKSKGKKRGRR